jgi:mono/diheme cytochrome c family protein
MVAALLVVVGRAVAVEQDQGLGAKLFIKYKCHTCHAVQSKGIGIPPKAKAEEEDDGWDDDEDEEDAGSPDLSGAGIKRDSEWLNLWLRKKISTEKGKKHMKRFKGKEEERQVLVDWLLTLKTPIEEPEKK